MSDLISREKVIDVLKQTGIIQDNDLGHLVVDEINRIPTAYEKEAVIEQLEELKNEAIDKWDGGASHRAYIKALEIVKAGGIDG